MMWQKRKHEKSQEKEDLKPKRDEKFSELLRETVDTDVSIYEEIYGKRRGRVDYSFLEQMPHEENQDYQEHMAAVKKAMKKRHINHFGRAAVLALCVLIGGFGIGIWMNSQPANALKFEAEKKFYEMKEGGFSTEETDGFTNDSSISVEITDMSEIEKAKRVMPNLPVPEYIPEGYELELLKVSVNENEVTDAEYRFRDKDKSLGIGILTLNNALSYQVKSDGAIIQEGEKQICIWKDKHTDSIGCSFIIENLEISIVGNISQEEAIEVAKNLSQ